MIHECKVQCHTMDTKTAEDLGIEDKGKWLPFIFSMDIITAAKLSSDEEDSPTYNCTSLFTNSGDTFIIDTPFKDFFKKFTEWNTLQFIIRDDNDSLPPLEDDDLDL
jgi:hypothetical protein